jgi:hypothetical protein
MTPFADDYFQAREAFLGLAQARGGRLTSHAIAARGPGGETLTIDTARFGAANPARVFCLVSGLHGVEGPAGSAAQLQFLAEDFPALTLPSDGAVLLIHAANPFGYAWGRRANEDNVDLNRNFMDWSKDRPRRPDYAALDPLLNPDTEEAPSDETFLSEGAKLLAVHGMRWLQARLTEGQYEFPRGLYYGGADAAASNLVLRDTFARAFAAAKEALIIDVHTGHGAYGDHTLILGHRADSPEAAWFRRAFALSRIEAPDGGDATAPLVSGKMTTAIAADAPHCAVRGFSLEFGTYEGVRMILGERAENWLHHHGDRSSARGRAIVEEVRDASAPKDPLWRRRVLNGARAATLDGWRGLFGADGF